MSTLSIPDLAQQDTWFSALLSQMSGQSNAPSNLPLELFKSNPAQPFGLNLEGPKLDNVSLSLHQSIFELLPALPTQAGHQQFQTFKGNSAPLPNTLQPAPVHPTTADVVAGVGVSDGAAALNTSSFSNGFQFGQSQSLGSHEGLLFNPFSSPPSVAVPTPVSSLSSVGPTSSSDLSDTESSQDSGVDSRPRSSSLNVNAMPFVPKFGGSPMQTFPQPAAMPSPTTQQAAAIGLSAGLVSNTWPPAVSVPAAVQAMWGVPTPAVTSPPMGGGRQLLPVAPVSNSLRPPRETPTPAATYPLPTPMMLPPKPKEVEILHPVVQHSLDTLAYVEADFPNRWAPSVKQIIFLIQALLRPSESIPFPVTQLSIHVGNTLNVQQHVVRTMPQLSSIQPSPVGVPGLVEVLGEFGWDGLKFPEDVSFNDLMEALKKLEHRGDEGETKTASENLLLHDSVGPERISYASRILNLYRRGVAGLSADFISRLVYGILDNCEKVDPKDVMTATTALNTVFLILKRCSAVDKTATELRKALQPEAFSVRLREVARLHGMEQKAAWCASKLISSDRDKTPTPAGGATENKSENNQATAPRAAVAPSPQNTPALGTAATYPPQGGQLPKLPLSSFIGPTTLPTATWPLVG